MTKYKDFAEYLRASPQDELHLSFADVERILGRTLPQSAYKANAWWANSRTRDSHNWAHEWLKAGWASSNVRLDERTVTFRRAAPGADHSVGQIASLYPTKLEHLLDLLVQANIDVSAWAFTGEGRPVEHPKANPDYCYDWSFGTEDEGYVLCIWCDVLDESSGRIVYHENVQDLARELERAARDPALEQAKRSRVQQQSRRARAFDSALDFSFRKARPVRVILTAGDRRSRDAIVDRSSTVELRSLDEVPWYVHQYSRDTGECLLVRGLAPDADVARSPQNFEEGDDSPGADDGRRVRDVAVRRGQAEFRVSLLAAYSRKCAVTGSPVAELLEAAHIIPHSENRNYRVTNGLLLRADIHTLFDLYLLSIDERLRVHVSKTLAKTEYSEFHGKHLVQLPDSVSDQPYAVSLQSRHERFVRREADRP